MTDKILQNSTNETCLSCKITSICCLLGVGGYLIHQAKQPSSQKHRFSLLMLGLGCIGLGVGEVFDKSPFRSYKDQKK